MTKKININTFIIITYFLLIFVPSKLPQVLKMPVTAGIAVFCLLLQVIALIRNAGDKKIRNESIILIIVTIALWAINFFI